jgi:uncharacterized protein
MGDSPRQSEIRRLTIYVGGDKTDVDQPLVKSIVQEARAMHIAGVTVINGSAGYGRSTRMHTAEVLFSTDLPLVIQIVDTAERIGPLIRRLTERNDIGIMTCETVELCGKRRLDD